VAFSGTAQCPEADFEKLFGSLLPPATQIFIETDTEHGRLLQVWVQAHEPGNEVELDWLFPKSVDYARVQSLRRLERSVQIQAHLRLKVAQELKAFSENLPQLIVEMLLFSSSEKKRRYNLTMEYLLVPKDELVRLSRSGAVLIGASAHAVPISGPFWEQMSPVELSRTVSP
jgi:hypothetical protein